MNPLATIQKLSNVKKHPNADKLFTAQIEEFQVVTGADVEDGAIVVYFSIDSILPELDIFEFMRPRNFLVSMVKLRGEISNGLIIPIMELKDHLPDDWFDVDINDLIGLNVTEALGVKKFCKPVPAQMNGEIVGDFPTDILSKTDEDRLENYPNLMQDLIGNDVYVTSKLDGSSATFLKIRGAFRVCTLNVEVAENYDNTLWKLAKKYSLIESLPDGFAIQCECVGEKIQNNPLKLKGSELFVFNVIDLKTRKLLPFDDIVEFCKKLNNIPQVELLYRGIFKWNTIQEIKQFANETKYPCGSYGEGIVIRLCDPKYNFSIGKELSLKIISENYKD